jgi:hypothetical protein
MAVTLLPMVTEVREKQQENASSPMDLTLKGILTEVSESLLEKV